MDTRYLLFPLLTTCLMLSGCELGNTMFQYSSGSTPWLGINLIPSKKREKSDLHSIRHQSPTVDKETNRMAELEVDQIDNDSSERFRKSAIRLQLPQCPPAKNSNESSDPKMEWVN